MVVKVVTVGLAGAVLATAVGLDLGIRKNEAIHGGVVRLGPFGKVLRSVHFQNLGSFVELVLFGCAALGLDLAELSEGALELAGETLAVDAEVGADAIFIFGSAQREERADSTAAARLSCQEVSISD